MNYNKSNKSKNNYGINIEILVSFF